MYENNVAENQIVLSSLCLYIDFKEKQQFVFLAFLLITSQFYSMIITLFHCKQSYFIQGKFKHIQISPNTYLLFENPLFLC